MMEPEEEPFRTYALRFTPRARADVDTAHARLMELAGEKVADEWQAGLFAAIATLATTPRRQIAPESARFQQEVRQLVYRRRPGSVAYRILYTIVETEEDAPYVRILHVRHGSARPITRAEARKIETEE
jgi:plasmid stabilization system protein ParE